MIWILYALVLDMAWGNDKQNTANDQYESNRTGKPSCQDDFCIAGIFPLPIVWSCASYQPCSDIKNTLQNADALSAGMGSLAAHDTLYRSLFRPFHTQAMDIDL